MNTPSLYNWGYYTPDLPGLHVDELFAVPVHHSFGGADKEEQNHAKASGHEGVTLCAFVWRFLFVCLFAKSST